MTPRRAFVWLLVITATSPVVGQAQPDADPARPGDYGTYYYLHKNYATVPDYMKSLQKSKLLEKHPFGVEPTAAFLAVIFSDNPKQVEKFAKCTRFTGRTKKAVIMALWRSGNGAKIDELFGATPDYAKGEFVPLMKIPIKLPGDLDMMWGAFTASGDVDYVNRIIDVMDEKTALSGETGQDVATRKSAEGSLKSNMMQHELVYRLIRKQAGIRTGSVQTKLQDMLDAMPNPSFPNKDGNFSAMLLAVDREQLEEFKKPRDQAPHISHKAVAHRGDIVGLKLVYTGFELSEDLNADVRYDLKFLDPDGKPYDETDLKNQEGTIRKLGTRFAVFDNSQVIMIRFEPKDKLGTYKIIAKIKDKVSKRSISLENQIELKE